MPTRSHLAETRARLRAELIARIAAGETLTSAFIDAAMARASNPTAKSLVRLALGRKRRQRVRLRNRPGKKWQ